MFQAASNKAARYTIIRDNLVKNRKELTLYLAYVIFSYPILL